MKNKDLIGKTILGFSFKGSGFVCEMKEHIGSYGTIIEIEGEFALIRFKKDEEGWYYPLKKVKKNLVKDSKRFFKDSEEQVEFTFQEIADIIDIPVELLRIKL